MDNIKYIGRQLSNLFPGECSTEEDIKTMQLVSEEVDFRFEFLASRAKVLMRIGKQPDPWHVMKHPIYLYLLSRVLFERGINDAYRIKDRLYCLNKTLHGCSLFYRVNLPKIFFLNYATQIVLGDCIYGENLVVYQGVTVGAYRDKAPTLGKNVVLMPNAIVSGSTCLGDNVVVSAGVAVINKSVPNNTIVFSGEGGNQLIYHPIKNNSYIDYFIDI